MAILNRIQSFWSSWAKMVLWMLNIIVVLLRLYLALSGKEEAFNWQTDYRLTAQICTKHTFKCVKNQGFLELLFMAIVEGILCKCSYYACQCKVWLPKESLTGILLCLPSHLGLHLKKLGNEKCILICLDWKEWVLLRMCTCHWREYVASAIFDMPSYSVLFAVFILTWKEFFFRISLWNTSSQ